MTYLEELHQLLHTAIERMKSEYPDFVIFTASIWTDKQANISAINFDNQENSLQNLKKMEEFNKQEYDYWLEEGDLEMAQEFLSEIQSPPTRATNPADFKLAHFEEIKHQQPVSKWHSSLQKFGKIAFEIIQKELNVDKENFELGINSHQEWYDQSWHIKGSKA